MILVKLQGNYLYRKVYPKILKYCTWLYIQLFVYLWMMSAFKNLESFNPHECLFGKISRINRITANIFRKHISPFGVSNSQASLLFIFAKFEGLTQKQLTDIAKLEKSSLHRNLKRLVDIDYVSRVDFPVIRITVKGKKLVNDIIPEWEKAMAEMRDLLGTEEDAIASIHQKLTLKKE